MPFIGQQPNLGTYHLLDSITTSATTTFALTLDGVAYTPASAQNLIVSLNGVTQAPQTAYTIEDSNIVFASALTTSDVIDYIMVLGDVLNVGTVSDGTITNAKLQNNTVNTAKLANGAVTTAKLTIDGDLIPTANVTYDLGSSTSRFKDLYLSGNTINLGGHSIGANTTHVTIDNIASLNAIINNDLTVGGDLIVNGNTTTISATTLNVDDPLIKLAAGNETSDLVDIGFLGHYSPDGGNTALHTGFFRDATNGQYYLFTGLEDAALDANTGPNTIDRTANTFTQAVLNVGELNITSTTDIDTGIRIKQFLANNVYADGNYYLFSDASRDADLRLHDFTNSTDILYFDKGTTHVGIGINAPSAKLDVRQEKTGGDLLIQVYNEDNSDTTTQTAGIAFGPDTRGGTARIIAVKENADFSTNAGRDVALTFSSVLNNSPAERMRISSEGHVLFATSTKGQSDAVEGILFSGTSPGLSYFTRDGGLVTSHSRLNSFGDVVRIVANGTAGGRIGSGASGVLSFYNGDGTTEHMRIEGDGDVRLGEYASSGSASSLLDLSFINTNETEFNAINLQSDNAAGRCFINYERGASSGRGDLIFGTSNARRARITWEGNVGVGTDAPEASLEVVSSSTIKSNGGNGKSDYYQLSVGGTNPGTGADGGGQVSNGIFHIGKGYANLNLGSFDADGDGTNSMRFWHQSFRGPNSGHLQWYWFNGSNFVGSQMTLNTNGNLTIAGTFTESSALRYKENIQDLEYDNIISQLKPKIYNKIGQEKQEVGLIAEDVEALDKNLVTYNDDGQVEGIQYTRLVPHLIAHIQKLEERLAALENG